ncbi:MAG TPA: zf-HC2 domain-containing protein [Acidimicrobiales bacterium]|nr:zf-HC2 domain-containing protein [Acidimicrobiales bacterium]
MSRAHDQVRRNLAAYALGALEDSEREAIEQHLVVCAECRQAVARARDTVAALVEPDDPPPPEVWERVTRAIRADPQQSSGEGKAGDGNG